MTGDEQTTGSILSSDSVKRKLAEDSKKWNVAENSRFGEMFADIRIQNTKDIAVAEAEKQQKQMKEKAKAKESLRIAAVAVETLDAEDRARHLDQREKPADWELLMTMMGMVVAAVLAVYMYF